MEKCLELASVAARTELPILILGESGTGKTLLARAIHNSSGRAGGPFVSFNAAALSETLVDSQLFGHERGAFTGAEKSVKGKFEQAHRGTLFIDEIADMSSVAQAKILRAVEYGEFERLGSERIQLADVRLISATHHPLRKYLESDQFRKDLFYRISGFTLTIPPLRDRPNDLRTLVAAEITLANRRHGKSISAISKDAVDALFAYSWPGNLRELNRVMSAAVALAENAVIDREVLLLDASEPTATAEQEKAARPELPSEDLSLRAMELRYVREILRRVGGNKAEASRVLGISRSTLDRKLKSSG